MKGPFVDFVKVDLSNLPLVKESSFRELNRPPAFDVGVVYCPYIPVMVTKIKESLNGKPPPKSISLMEDYWLPKIVKATGIPEKYLTVPVPIVSDTMLIKETNPFKSETLKLRAS